MGMLKNVWEDPHIDLYSKFFFCIAMPLNLLLWGCKAWALKENVIDNIHFFIHQSIRRIIGINMTQVKEEKISNEKLRGMFYNISDTHRLIAMKQLTFIEKVVRRENSFFSKQLLPEWVNHKRKAGGLITTRRRQ